MNNRKSIVIIIAFMASVFASAQVGEYRNKFALGFSGGVAMNNVDFNPSIKQKQHVGSEFGLALRYTCEKYIKAVCAVQMEVNYAQVGWSEDIDPVVVDDVTRADFYKRNVGQIQVPLLARMAWGRERRGVDFFIVAGPQINYTLSEKEECNFNFDDPDLEKYRASGVISQYGKFSDNSIDYGITAGAGLELNTSIGHFILEGRYFYGLGDFYGNSKKDPFARSANMTMHARLSYMIDLN